MGTNTTKLGLLKPSENDFYNQQTEQADNWDKVDKFADDIQKNVDFNLLATLGIEYGGILNNTDAKVAGKAYYDTTGEKLYKCIANTSINYADAGFFEAISNNDLLTKISKIETGCFSVFSSAEGFSYSVSDEYHSKLQAVKRTGDEFMFLEAGAFVLSATYELTNTNSLPNFSEIRIVKNGAVIERLRADQANAIISCTTTTIANFRVGDVVALESTGSFTINSKTLFVTRIGI